MSVGEKIRSLRLTMGMSQRELAGPELSKALISQIENGKVNPSIKSLAIIAARLDHPLHLLMTDNDGEQANLSAMIRSTQGFLDAGQFDNAVDVAQRALNQANSSGNREMGWRVELLLGQALYKMGKVPEALERFEEVYQSANRYNEDPFVAESMYWCGNCYYWSSQYHLAYRCYKRTRDKSHNLKMLSDLHAMARLFMGSSSYRIGNVYQSLEIYQALYRDTNSKIHHQLKIDAGLGLSWSLHVTGQTEDAIHITQQIRQLSKQFQNYNLGKIESNLGVFSVKAGNSTLGLRLWSSALEFFEKQNNRLGQATVREEIANYHLQRNNLDDAENIAQVAIQLLQNSSRSLQHGRLYRLLGLIEQARGNIGYADKWFQLAMGCFRLCKATAEIDLTDDLWPKP